MCSSGHKSSVSTVWRAALCAQVIKEVYQWVFPGIIGNISYPAPAESPVYYRKGAYYRIRMV